MKKKKGLEASETMKQLQKPLVIILGSAKISDPMVITRKILTSIWAKAQLRGRCWGRGGKNNPFNGTNITLAIGKELITISMNREKQLIMHQFKLVEQTKLGDKISKILQEDGLLVIKRV